MHLRTPQLSAIVSLAASLLAACSNDPDFDLPGASAGEDHAAALPLAFVDDPTLGGAPLAAADEAASGAPVGAAPIAHGQGTLPIALTGWPLTLEGTSLDAVVRRNAPSGVRAIVALRDKHRVRLVELAAGPDGRATVAAQRTFEGQTPGAVALAEQGGTTVATWVDAGELHVAATTTDAGAFNPETLLGEASAVVVGNAVIAPVASTATSDGGFLVCAAIDPGGPRCAVLTNVSSVNMPARLTPSATLGRDGWAPIGKLGAHVVEAIAESPRGFMVVTSTCVSRGGCARKSVSVTRLGAHAESLKKATRRIAEIQSRRGVTAIRTSDGILLVARRVGAGETAAWHLAEDQLREAPGRYSGALGGFFAEGTTVVVENGLLVMRNGFPVAPPRARRWTRETGLADPEPWPPAVEALFPTHIEQTIAAAPGIAIFATPARKGHITALVLILDRT